MKCPEDGCLHGEYQYIAPTGGKMLRVIYCSYWKDISWHPVTGGRVCPMAEIPGYILEKLNKQEEHE